MVSVILVMIVSKKKFKNQEFYNSDWNGCDPLSIKYNVQPMLHISTASLKIKILEFGSDQKSIRIGLVNEDFGCLIEVSARVGPHSVVGLFE